MATIISTNIAQAGARPVRPPTIEAYMRQGCAFGNVPAGVIGEQELER